MKKQLQKILFLLFLSGCMMAPVNHFESYFQPQKKYQIPFQKVILTDDLKMVDSAHHVGNKLSQSPVQIVQNWADKSLVTTPDVPHDLQLVLHQSEIVRQEFPAEYWWQFDFIQDTLYYDIELIQRDKDKNINRSNFGGKVFVKMNKKSSLAEKEKQWATLYHQMLQHLENEISKIPHVIPLTSQD